MVDMNEEKFDHLLGKLSLRFGFERTIIEIIYPFLEKIGILWQTGNITPAQEHFISNLIRQKIIVAIDALPFPSKTARKIVLFLPENELHEIGLLFYHYVAKKSGYRTYYLGQMLPYNDLKIICQIHQPHYIITSQTGGSDQETVRNLLATICQDFPNATVLASGAAIREMTFKGLANLKVFHKALELKPLIEKVSSSV